MMAQTKDNFRKINFTFRSKDNVAKLFYHISIKIFPKSLFPKLSRAIGNVYYNRERIYTLSDYTH